MLVCLASPRDQGRDKDVGQERGAGRSQEVWSDLAVMRTAAAIEKEELRAGAELQHRFGEFAGRYRQAVSSGDHEVLARICPGKHGRWGRACVLDADHGAATGGLHWGLTGGGDPIAWVGSAPTTTERREASKGPHAARRGGRGGS